jgi:hypothetical protein
MAPAICRWQFETEVEWVGVAAYCGRVSTSLVPGSYAATGARKEVRMQALGRVGRPARPVSLEAAAYG